MSDITYIWTRSGWFYLAIIMDLYSSKVIRWSVSDKRDTGLVIAALMQALVTHNYVRGQCWDNAPTESWFRTLKMETGIAKAYLPGPAEVETVLFDWIET